MAPITAGTSPVPVTNGASQPSVSATGIHARATPARTAATASSTMPKKVGMKPEMPISAAAQLSRAASAIAADPARGSACASARS